MQFSTKMGLGKGKKGSSGKDSGLVYQIFPRKSDDYSRPSTQSPGYEDYRIKQLSEQLAQKTSDLERLRDYVTQLEEGEKGLIQELTRQIAVKDEEVSRIAALYAKKESENRKLSSEFESHIISQKEHAKRIKSLLVKKEEENVSSIETLKRELEKKDSEIFSLRQSLFNNRMSENETKQLNALFDEQNIRKSVQASQDSNLRLVEELNRKLAGSNDEVKSLERQLFGEQRLNKSIQSRLREQIASMAGQAEELKSLILEKETIVQNLEKTFERQNSEKEEGLQREIEKRDEEIAALKQLMLQDKRQRHLTTLEASQDSNVKLVEELNRKLAGSNDEVKSLERQLFGEQRLNKSIQSRLREQIASMAGQAEELKSFLIEKEKLTQNLETAFEKRVAAREEELRHIKESFSKKPEPGIHKELERLEAEIRVKEESSKLMAEEFAKLKERAGILQKRLEERQKIFFESERAYEQIIGQLREQHDARIKALVRDSAQKEAALRAELEKEKAKTHHEMLMIKEKEKQIEETLLTFSRTSERMLKLGAASMLDEAGTGASALADLKEELEAREKHLSGKESELKELLSTAEGKITELKSKEAEVERKEKLLLREQEALNKELDVLNSAGLEITKSKKYLQQKLERIGTSEASTRPQLTSAEEGKQNFMQGQQPQFAEIAERQQPFAPAHQPQTQMMVEPTSGVEEAQEETTNDLPRFSGIPQGPVQEEAGTLEEEEFQVIKPEIAKPARIKSKIPAKAGLKQRPKKAKAAARKSSKALKAKSGPVPKPVKSQIKAKAQSRIRRNVQSDKVRFATANAAAATEAIEKELFTEMGGYSELDEIKSVVEVGLQHGDSLEQIRESLITSGYSRQNIEKALGSVRK